MYFRVADWLKALSLALLIIIVYSIVGAIRTTIIIFAFAAFITFIANPIILFLTSKGALRSIAIIVTYITFLVLLIALFILVSPVIRDQISNFTQTFPGLLESVRRSFERIQSQLAGIRFIRGVPFDINTLISQAVDIVVAQLRRLLFLIPSLIALVTDIVLVFIISIYMLFYLPQIDRMIRESLPDGTAAVYDRFLVSTKTAFGRYIVAQFTLMLIVGILAGLGVSLAGLPFPFLLGLWAGLTEIIPVLGPILGAIPSVIIAFTIEPILALWVTLIFIVIQQIENSVVVPLVFRGTVGINPLLVIFTIVAAGEIAGILGIFIAVPILVLITAIVTFIRNNFSYVRVEGEPDRIIIKE
ncbi:MAG TPA: AI-2E family transporter [Anaerolineae bacterium]|nr:AI-2E family transporter [Anaerolineae bacterium]